MFLFLLFHLFLLLLVFSLSSLSLSLSPSKATSLSTHLYKPIPSFQSNLCTTLFFIVLFTILIYFLLHTSTTSSFCTSLSTHLYKPPFSGIKHHAHTLHTAPSLLGHQVYSFTSPVKPQELMSQKRLNISPSSSLEIVSSILNRAPLCKSLRAQRHLRSRSQSGAQPVAEASDQTQIDLDPICFCRTTFNTDKPSVVAHGHLRFIDPCGTSIVVYV